MAFFGTYAMLRRRPDDGQWEKQGFSLVPNHEGLIKRIMDLKSIFGVAPNTILMVTVCDLKEFALSIIDECKKTSGVKEAPEQYLNREEVAPEQYLNREEVAKMCGVSTNTLWRWEKIGYLVPNKVGHRNVYPLSKVKKLMDGESVNLKNRKEE